MIYPELLKSLSGIKITTKEEWEEFRRDECMTLLANYVYGVAPIDSVDDVSKLSKENFRIIGIITMAITALFSHTRFEIRMQ